MPHPVFTKIANDSLAAVAKGQYTDDSGNSHSVDDLGTPEFKSYTEYYPPDSELLVEWKTTSAQLITPLAEITLARASTLEGIRLLDDSTKRGVLNFASATKPGGGFLAGAQAQEESLARSSNIYSSLMTPTGQRFYRLHKSAAQKPDKRYTHSIIFTKNVRFFRTDKGVWIEPVDADVVTSAAVNAGAVRSRYKDGDPEIAIEVAMRERMGRILRLFEEKDIPDVILGSFGTGVFRNNVAMVARLWVELLLAPDARFAHSFKRVVFAIIDEKTCAIFRNVFAENKVEFAEVGT
ncbi:DUF2263 domain-containing protein [Mycena indigotica]|uniref:DUF2263 domain-containing protein n=1 Tax=Mycena indigotica TaxID=2126181 RepID=A0A8H6WFS9_9AGAR|nr:DUF2263 domain-containing protein [Mycena indigotica]KAF7315076.1 DUF2263 domain-containing protein [Mycena indigotica]